MQQAVDYQAIADAMCRQRLAPFIDRAFVASQPGRSYEFNWHIDCIAEHLEAVYRNEIRRIIINVPPRTLKSFSVAEAFPAWVLGKQPQSKFITTGVTHEIAENRAVGCKMIMQSQYYKRLFPATVINPDFNRRSHYETTMRGQYYAAGITGTITSIGCDYFIVDDPVKPDEALSDTMRGATLRAMSNTVFSRDDDPRGGRFIMIMQRVHQNDPSGHFLEVIGPGCVHLKLPAIASQPIRIDLGARHWEMANGDLLFPARLTQEELEFKRTVLGDYNFAGQYLQEPVPLGGGEFRDDWVQYYGNGETVPRKMNVCIIVDPSAGEDTNRKRKKLSDFTAMMVIGFAPDNNKYLLDIIRDRLNPTERVDTLFMLHSKWNDICGRAPKVGYERYGMMTDTHYIKEKMALDNYRFPLIELGGQVSKEERIRRLIPDMQRGNWFFPDRINYCDKDGRTWDLVHELVYSEMPNFPRSRYDDMMDALSRVYEPEMNMVFPKVERSKSTHTPRVSDVSSIGWMEF